jgi:hypothetical protein
MASSGRWWGDGLRPRFSPTLTWHLGHVFSRNRGLLRHLYSTLLLYSDQPQLIEPQQRLLPALHLHPE